MINLDFPVEVIVIFAIFNVIKRTKLCIVVSSRQEYLDLSFLKINFIEYLSF